MIAVREESSDFTQASRPTLSAWEVTKTPCAVARLPEAPSNSCDTLLVASGVLVALGKLNEDVTLPNRWRARPLPLELASGTPASPIRYQPMVSTAAPAVFATKSRSSANPNLELERPFVINGIFLLIVFVSSKSFK
jgi:hypothetical protein